MDPHRILVVEDDESLRLVLADNLETAGYAVTSASNLAEARRAIALAPYDLVVLDVMLPDGNGHALAAEIRRQCLPTRILLLTARSLEDDIVQGFDAGADDYVVKPYRLRELMARVHALVRRAPAPQAPERRLAAFAGFTLDLDARELLDPASNAIVLTKTEFDLLAAFVAHPGLVRTRDQLLDAAWGADVLVDPRTVDNFVSALKKKLAWSASAQWRIVALRGVGYRFEVGPELER